jgi:hypothetical protein
MWFQDFRDVYQVFPEPNPLQALFADRALCEVEALKRTLQKLAVRQQREIIEKIIEEFAGKVFLGPVQGVYPIGYSEPVETAERKTPSIR